MTIPVNIIHWGIICTGLFTLFLILIGGVRKSKTTWIIKTQYELVKDRPTFLVFKKTGLFAKEYIGHRYDLHAAESLTGKHLNVPWARQNRIILKL